MKKLTYEEFKRYEITIDSIKFMDEIKAIHITRYPDNIYSICIETVFDDEDSIYQEVEYLVGKMVIDFKEDEDFDGLFHKGQFSLVTDGFADGNYDRSCLVSNFVVKIRRLINVYKKSLVFI